MTPIDWSLIADAIFYYEALGYEYCEVPWLVPDNIARMTYDAESLQCQAGTLIGSAEQGFLALPSREGKMVSCSPCFRKEPVIDRLHQSWFMKVELYQEGSHVEELVRDAFNFFQKWVDCTLYETPEGIDIVASGIEIGSYGEHHEGNRHWTYGTGLALPRFSIAQEGG
jgi:hypothetical protein